MARPTIRATQDQWARLASYLLRRIDQLDWTQEDAIAEAKNTGVGPSRSVWLHAFGHSQPNGTMAPASLKGIDRTFGWEPGSCQRILTGGEPTVVSTPAKRPRQEINALTTLVRQMRAELSRLERRLNALEENRDDDDAGRRGARSSR